MDTDSDEEWNEDTERQAVKRNRALGGFRLPKLQSRSMSLDRKKSSGSPHGLRNPNQEQESLGVLALRPSSGENVLEDNNEDKGKERLYPPCSCSCSQSSGCKTKKCECKAAGGLCGTQCGCNSVKCNNREAAMALEEQQPFSVASPIQMEVAQGVASAGVDKNRRRLHDPSEAGEFVQGGESPVHIVTEEEHVTKRADRSLAVHGASLLESALKDELRDSDVRDGGEEKQQTAPDAVEDVAFRKSQRRPLQDIGNKVSTKGRHIAKQRRRQTAVIQLVPLGPACNAGSGIAATTPALAAAAVAAAAAANMSTPSNNTIHANVPLATVPDVSPLWRQHSLMRKNSSGQLSPLCVRDNKVGASNSGIGGTSDDAQGGVKSAAKSTGSAGPGSPNGPGRGSDGKENIHRNSFV